MTTRKIHRRWARFWMRFAGLSSLGRMAVRLAECGAPPYKERSYLARIGPSGYISSRAHVFHPEFRLEPRVFIGDGVEIFQNRAGGTIQIGEDSHIYRDCILETGRNGSLQIGSDVHIQPRCQLSAYVGNIRISARVQMAPGCGLYPYNHGVAPGRPIKGQPLTSAGDIVVEEDAWIGFGVVVLENVRIGVGAVVAAGAVVTRNVPDGGIAAGNPARLIRYRGDAPPPPPERRT